MHMSKSSLADRVALAILVYFILMASSYSASTPIFEAPDEAAHFLYAHNIVEERALPLMTNRANVLASLSWQRHQPPLLYLMSALLIGGIDRSDVEDYLRINPLAVQGNISLNNLNTHLRSQAETTGNTLTAVRMMRLLCLILASGTLWFIYRAGQLVSGQTMVGLTAMLMVASMPTFIFIAGSINNDNLVTFLHTVGVYWLLNRWQARRIGIRHAAILGVIAAGLALAKFQGLPLLGLTAITLLSGGMLRRWTWRAVTLGLAGLVLGVVGLAGWWYIRNQVLYGDLVAIQVTRSIWGRGPVTTDLTARLVEFAGVWQSMWYMLGYLNIPGPAWLYPYTSLLSMVGVLAGMPLWSQRGRRFYGLLLALVSIMLWVTLYFSTGQINASQGRFLFPALVAFSPLVVMGLYHLPRMVADPIQNLVDNRLKLRIQMTPKRFRNRYIVVVLFPLIIVALMTPAALLRAYRPLAVIESLPTEMRVINRQAEGLLLIGYQLKTPTVRPDGVVELDLYLRGRHPQDPALVIAILDPLTGSSAGVADFYPGMTALSTLDPALTYRARARIGLKTSGGMPRQLNLLIRWRVIDPVNTGQGRVLHWDDESDALLLAGPLLQDPVYVPSAPQVPVEARFGDAIQLMGYSLPASRALHPGDRFSITLFWKALRTQADDLRLAFGLLDAEDRILAQTDGIPLGLPSTVWLPNMAFTDTRELLIPAEAPSGAYRLYLAWYYSRDNERLPLIGRDDGLYLDLPAVQVLR
jgi:Predicted membrane protein (DUF2142)